MKKPTLTQILLLMLTLLGGWLGWLLVSKQEDRSQRFRSSLVDFSPESITKLRIGTAADELQLFKQDTLWELELSPSQRVSASQEKMRETIDLLQRITPDLKHATSQEAWAEAGVDSTGTRVEVFEGDKKVLDLVVGKTDFAEQSYYTYVRLYEDEEVYVCQKILGYQLNTQKSYYRNSRLLEIREEQLQDVSFDYGTESFSLTKTAQGWHLGSEKADSLNVEKYFNDLYTLTSEAFVDNYTPRVEPVQTVRFLQKDGQTQEVYRYQEGATDVLESALNPDTFFADSAAMHTLFKPSAFFRQKSLELIP